MKSLLGSLLSFGPFSGYKRVISIFLMAIAQFPGLNPAYAEILNQIGLSLGGVAIADVLVNKK